MRRILLTATAALLWLGVSAAPASAHSVSGVGATNFHTHLKSVTPAVPGLDVKVVESGSRLQVENHTGEEVLVLGYKGEPYLRIGPEGVFQNRLSTATYINASRKGKEAPESARNAKIGDTDWEKVSDAPVARWHDHRIHWMLPTNPPVVRDAPDKTHVIQMGEHEPDWVVAMEQAGRPITVKGDLVWEPGPSALPWFVLVAALVGLAVVVGRSRAWAAGLASIAAVLVVVDVFHAVGLGLANAGGFGERLAKAVTQSPVSLLGWVAGVLAVVWLLRRGADGLPLAVLAGLLIALLGGVSDLSVLSHSEVPFGFGAAAARVAVAVSIGLGFGLAAAAALRLAAGGGGVAARPPVREEPVPAS